MPHAKARPPIKRTKFKLSTDELLRTRHVRIAAPAVSPGWLTGHLLTIDSVAYVMQTIRPEAWRIPRHQVTAIQIGAGRGPTESILRGAGIGALAGGGLPLTYEVLACRLSTDHSPAP